ncbi:MAG: PBP1A family penicillin-binding protein [Bdellovibrionota bacterium]
MLSEGKKITENPFLQKEGMIKPSLTRRIILGVFLAAFLSILGISSAIYLWLDELGVLKTNKQDLSIILDWKSPDNSLVFDKNGNKIGEFFSNYHIFVPFEKIPPSLINSIIAIEDKNFWYHNGIDIKAITRAGLAFIKNQGIITQGASTITQQVVRHFLLSNEKSITRKIKEISLAIALEKYMSKKRILEIYTNALYLGHGSYGVGSAAWRYFGKPIEKIEEHESAILAGLFQLPSHYDPHKNPEGAKERQKLVLKSLVRNGKISLKKAKQLAKRELKYKKYESIYGKKSPYFIDYIKEQATKLIKNLNSIKNHGLRIYTTLDPIMQNYAENAIMQNAHILKKAENKTVPKRNTSGGWNNRRIEAAIIVTSSKNGNILAMVGGRDYEKSKFNRTTDALRSPGSSFKPIVYSYALERGKKWSDVVYVSPVTVDGNYRPRNPKNEYLTESTLQRAFYKSMNAPTISISEQLGVSNIIEHAKRLGITSPIKNEYGTALGSSEVTMIEMAKVYSTFANSGVRVGQSAISKITDREGNILYQQPPLEERSEKVMSPQISYLITQGMRSVLQYGTGYHAASLSKWAVGKTGTSNESKDNWFCGYTSDITAIVWVGTDDYTGLAGNMRGSVLALPIWEKFMHSVIDTKEPKDFAEPSGIVSEIINPKYGNKSKDGIKMWFTEHNVPKNKLSPLEYLQTSENYRNIFSR